MPVARKPVQSALTAQREGGAMSHSKAFLLQELPL
jgi:hypothetical protein